MIDISKVKDNFATYGDYEGCIKKDNVIDFVGRQLEIIDLASVHSWFCILSSLQRQCNQWSFSSCDWPTEDRSSHDDVTDAILSVEGSHHTRRVAIRQFISETVALWHELHTFR